MKTKLKFPLIAPALLVLLSAINHQLSTASAQGTAFTYQGQLQNNGVPASGTYNLQFSLYTNSTGGTAVAGPVTNSAVTVSNGLFTVAIDFGAAVWNGQTNWLQIGVETNGGTNFTLLSPLQQVTPTPYAIFAEGANAAGLTGTVPMSSLSGIYGGALSLTNTGNSFSGSGSGLNGVNAATLGGLRSSNFWQTTGNTGTSPTNGNFLGTLDNQPLELHANGQRIFQLLPDTSANNAPDIIGGSPTNTMTSGLVGATISGGAANTIGPSSLFGANPYGDFGGYPTIGASYSTIGGGFLNEIQSNATFSTVAGGALNTIQVGAIESTIGGGFSNTVLLSGSWSTIGGGTHHTIGSANGFIGGGWNNTIQINAGYSAIAGGLFNVIQTNSFGSVIGGGDGNIIGPDGNGGSGSYSGIGSGAGNTIDEEYSFVGGGQGNFIQGLADHAFIGGGQNNTIVGSYSLPVYGFIAGGQNNLIQTNSSYDFIGGGYLNTIRGYAPYSMIGGGLYNLIYGDTNDYGTSVIVGGYVGTINSNSWNSFIGGGGNNTIGTNSDHSVIVGGDDNTILGLAQYGMIGGGFQNTVGAYAATVPGGTGNFAGGAASFAAGQHAQATNNGAFVWSDDSAATNFSSTTSNQFSVRAMGGVRLVTGGAGMTLDGQGVGPLGNYVFAYNTAPQPVTPSIFQNATFTTVAQLNGWTVGGSSQFICNQSGLYLIQYTADASVADSMSMRGELNFIEIPGSQTFANSISFGTTTVISKSFLASVSVGNILTIQYTGNSGSDQLQSGGSGSFPTSISLTITRIQ